MMTPQPPRIVRALFSRLLPRGPVRDGVLGDLHEMYVERRTHRGRGRLRADTWYCLEVTFAASRYLIDRWSRWREADDRRRHPKRANSQRTNPVETLLQDIRFAGRVLKKSPGFAAAAALTIALGIGATTTIFSTVNAVLLRPPPGIHDADELVRVYRIAEDGSSYNSVSYPSFEQYRDADIGLSNLAGMALTAATVGGGSEDPEFTFGLLVTHNFFDMLGVRPAVGRLFVPEDDESSRANLVAVLSHAATIQNGTRRQTR